MVVFRVSLIIIMLVALAIAMAATMQMCCVWVATIIVMTMPWQAIIIVFLGIGYTGKALIAYPRQSNTCCLTAGIRAINSLFVLLT